MEGENVEKHWVSRPYSIKRDEKLKFAVCETKRRVKSMEKSLTMVFTESVGMMNCLRQESP